MINLDIPHPTHSGITLSVTVADGAARIIAEDENFDQLDISGETAEYAVSAAIHRGLLTGVDWESFTRAGWVEMGNQYSNSGYWEINTH